MDYTLIDDIRSDLRFLVHQLCATLADAPWNTPHCECQDCLEKLTQMKSVLVGEERSRDEEGGGVMDATVTGNEQTNESARASSCPMPATQFTSEEDSSCLEFQVTAVKSESDSALNEESPTSPRRKRRRRSASHNAARHNSSLFEADILDSSVLTEQQLASASEEGDETEEDYQAGTSYENTESGTRHRRTELTLEQRLEIIRALEAQEKGSSVARRFGVSAGTVTRIFKQRNVYLPAAERNMLNGTQQLNQKRRSRSCVFEEINDLTYHFYEMSKAENIPISGRTLRDQALRFAKQLGQTDFKASNGWLEKFKKAHNIETPRGTPVITSADNAAVEDATNWIMQIHGLGSVSDFQ